MTREISFRYDVYRGGSRVTQLFPAAEIAPLIYMDDTSAIKTTLSGSFIRSDLLHPLTDEIHPVMMLDGVEHKLGVYLPATVTYNNTETEQTVTIEAYDRCWVVRDTRTENLLLLYNGANYVTVVEQLLTICGISIVLATPTTATLPEMRQDWDVGTSYLDIVNQLLGEINYKSLWFTPDGAAVLEPVVLPTATNMQHTLDASNIRDLLLPEWSNSTDVYSAPNVFICLCANPEKNEDMVAVAENTNPESILSIQRRGRRIAEAVWLNNIAGQTELEEYAQRLLFDSMARGQTITVQTALLPGYGVDDVTALHYDDLSAICIERKWSMELQVGGTMKHTLERIVYNLE